MQILDFAPGRLLQPFIKSYKIIETVQGSTNRILPGSSIVMAFRIKGQVSDLNEGTIIPIPSAVISGLRKSVRLINYQQNSATLLVLFREAGAAAFFKEPLHDLFDHSISLENLADKHNITHIEEQLNGAGNHTERIAIVEKFLSAILITATLDPMVLTAINTIRATKGMIRIKELAKSLYISQDAFEKRFRKTVGTSPKQFALTERMNAIILNKQVSQSLRDIALDAGYYDQPHFNKEFKLFTGQTPADFFKAPSFW